MHRCKMQRTLISIVKDDNSSLLVIVLLELVVLAVEAVWSAGDGRLLIISLLDLILHGFPLAHSPRGLLPTVCACPCEAET